MIRRTTVVCDQTGTEEDLASRGELYGQTLYGLPSGWVQFSIDGQSYHFSSSTNATNWIASRVSSYPVLLSQSIEDKAPRAVTRVVASSSATEEFKSQADYVCDGVTDEEEINAAIADCISYGGTVVLSDHLFYVSSPVLITGRVELVGQGDSNTVIIAAANTNVVEISGTVYNAAIRRLKIDGNNTRGGGAGYSGKGLVLTGGYTITLEDVGIINTGEENVYSSSGSVFVFNRVACSGAGDSGSNVVGISLNQSSGPQFNRVTVQNSTGTGILFSGTNDIHCTDVAVDLCNAATTGYGWVINAGNGHMAGCSVGACGTSSIDGGGLYIYGASHDLVITNFGSRDHRGTSKYSLWIADSTSTMYSIEISNSIFTGSDCTGAYFGGQINDLTFIGNTVKGNAQGEYAIAADFRGVGHCIRNNPGLPAILDVEDIEALNSSGATMIPGEHVVYGHSTAASYTGVDCNKEASQGNSRVMGVVVGRSDPKAYTTGTCTTTNGSGTVTGSGTTWTAAMVGRLFRDTGDATDNTWYTITARASDTEITISPVFAGTGGSAHGYTIGTVMVRPIANGQKGYVRRLGKFGGASYSTGTVTTTNGTYKLTGSGTTWTIAMVGSIFQDTSDSSAWYTIVGFNSATELLIEPAYASAGGAGHNYVINKGLRVEGTADIDIQDLVGTYGTTAGLGMEAASGDVANAIALEAYTSNDENGVIDVLMIPPVQVK